MKTNKLMIRTVLSAALILISFNSCKKSYLDINKNPNSPADVDVNLLLPSAEAAIGQALGNDIQIFGGVWAQYWTQNPNSSQYRTYEQYQPNAGDYDYPWSALYSDGLQDMANIVTKGTAESKGNYVACAKILQAYTFQLLTDNWGDIPFNQSLQGTSGVTSPKFDAQKDVYAGIIKLAKDGVAAIDMNAAGPGSDDLLLGGDMALWQEFGNTLLLKIYLRLAYIDPATAQAGIASIASGPFLGSAQQVQINYINSGGNTNPLYGTTSILTTSVQNLVASKTSIDYLSNNNDPRIDAFYEPASTGQQVGIAQGDFNTQTSTFSTPTPMTGANVSDPSSASAPVIFMSSYESMFLQAEAAARGWLTSDAGSLYSQAITEDFEVLQLTDSQATAYATQTAIAFPSSGTLENKINAIITQKWVSMNGTQCDEAWTEWRRTTYPGFFTISKTSLAGAGQLPQRFFYPSVELTRNQNFPGQKSIGDKMYWDTH